MSEIVFVADFFSTDLIGGAELTTDALIESSPFSVTRIKSSELSRDHILKYRDSYWIFGNWSMASAELLQIIANSCRYSIVEYDYKMCRHRSQERHYAVEGSLCDCSKTSLGKFISMFYGNARSIFWMSEKQRDIYHLSHPHLSKNKQEVISSVFSDQFFSKIDDLNSKQNERKGWIVLESRSWIKGTEEAESWCHANDKEIKKISGVSPDELLKMMSESEGLVYLPRGGDTCPRLVIEAKLLGCELKLNENVQHSSESWFQLSPHEIKDYLKSNRERFWSIISKSMEWRPTISGYTTTRNCISQKYPYEECINSMLEFCDEVVVLDGGSTDGTWEKLANLASANKKLKISQSIKNIEHPRYAPTVDGMQKAEARDMCTMEFCWQMDADEVLPPWDGKKVIELCYRFGTSTDLISLPVIEYWGSLEKIRVDVNPWKWRLSRNDKNITHGIPGHLRCYDENGFTYAKQGTDSCDYIYRDSLEYVPHSTFYGKDVHEARMHALAGNKDALKAYGQWIKTMSENLPTVRHFSWVDIKRKIRSYRDYWQKFWESMYNIPQEDTSENNKFFDKPWSEVTEEEIDALAERMKNELGGHIFHSKIDWNHPTPWIDGFDS